MKDSATENVFLAIKIFLEEVGIYFREQVPTVLYEHRTFVFVAWQPFVFHEMKGEGTFDIPMSWSDVPLIYQGNHECSTASH